MIATRRHSKYKSGGALGPGDNEFKFDFGHISGNDLQTIALGLRRPPRLECKCQGSFQGNGKQGAVDVAQSVQARGRQSGTSSGVRMARELCKGDSDGPYKKQERRQSSMAKEAERDLETPCHRLWDERVFAHWPFCSCD